MSNGDLWVLEWHHRSNNIHIQPLASTVGVNLSKFHLDVEPGAWVPICVGTRDEVDAAADSVRPTLIERERSREQV